MAFQPSRVLIVSLLLFSLPSIILTNSANGQEYTTETGYETVTTIATSYGLNVTGTSYATSAQQLRHVLYSRLFVMEGVPSDPRYGCMRLDLPFTINNGERITGSFSSDSSVSFHIIEDFRFHRHGMDCIYWSWETVLSKDGVGSYSIDLPLNSGVYHFIFLNWNKQSANVNFDVSVTSGSSTTVTSTSFNYVSVTRLQTVTSIGFSLMTRPAQFYMQPSNAGWLVALVIAVALVSYVTYNKYSRKKKP